MKKMIVLISFCSIVLLLSSGCKQKTTEPSDADTVQYVVKPQHDIPWASLGQTAWPKALHDAQCTGRSSYNGPANGRVKASITVANYATDPVMGPDSVFYIVADTSFYAVTLNGTQLWKVNLGRVHGLQNYNSPILTSDGALLVGTNNGISAFNKNGALLWNTQLNDAVILKSCAVGLDGSIYAISYSKTLYAVSKSGTILWQKNAPSGDFTWGTMLTIPFAPDGSMFYVGGSTAEQSLYAINTNGEILWSDSLGGMQHGAISVDVDGNVYSYFGNDLVSVSSTGKVRWRITGTGFNWNVSIDPDGNIAYLANGNLVLVDNNGQKRWSVPVGMDDYGTHIVCDASGTFYIETADNESTYKVQAISNSGKILWTVPVDARVKTGGPSLTREGYLLFPQEGMPLPKYVYVIE